MPASRRSATRSATCGPMTSTYRAILLTRKGGLDALELRELPLEAPGPGQVRVRVRATGVGFTDIIMRRGYYPYAPKLPFTPGYEVLGDVEALGPGVTALTPGQRVAALTVHGGYAEYITRDAGEFIPVPEGLDDAEVTALILNYVTAYQMIHRVARLRAGPGAPGAGGGGGGGGGGNCANPQLRDGVSDDPPRGAAPGGPARAGDGGGGRRGHGPAPTPAGGRGPGVRRGLAAQGGAPGRRTEEQTS